MDKITDHNASLKKAMELAQSDAGQQLYTMLQQQGGGSFQEAMNQAASGNYEQAKKAISGLLATPEAQALLKKMGG